MRPGEERLIRRHSFSGSSPLAGALAARCNNQGWRLVDAGANTVLC